MLHNSSSTCVKAEQWINLLLDGQLDAAGRCQLDSHLEKCEECGRLLASYRIFSERISGWSRVDDQDSRHHDVFAGQVMAAIAQSPKGSASRSEAWARIGGFTAVVIIAAVFWRSYGAMPVDALVSSPLPISVPGSVHDLLDSLASIVAMAGQWLSGLLPNSASLKMPVWLMEAGAIALVANAYFITRFGRRRVTG